MELAVNALFAVDDGLRVGLECTLPTVELVLRDCHGALDGLDRIGRAGRYGRGRCCVTVHWGEQHVEERRGSHVVWVCLTKESQQQLARR